MEHLKQWLKYNRYCENMFMTYEYSIFYKKTLSCALSVRAHFAAKGSGVSMKVNFKANLSKINVFTICSYESENNTRELKISEINGYLLSQPVSKDRKYYSTLEDKRSCCLLFM